MKKKKLKSVTLIKHTKYLDLRGDFCRFFCKNTSKKLGLKSDISQFSVSSNKKRGTLRGLHFQLYPFEEDKYITCIQGKLFDVVVDLRKKSKDYLKVFTNILSAQSSNVLYIPRGFAHGFQTIEDNTIIIYGMTQKYNKSAQSGLRYDDPKLKIKWPLKQIIISKRDKTFGYIK